MEGLNSLIGRPVKIVIRAPEDHPMAQRLKEFTERRSHELATFHEQQHASLIELARLVEANKSIGPPAEIWETCHRLMREAKEARERDAQEEAAAKRAECHRIIEQDRQDRFDPELDEIRRTVVLAMGHLSFVIRAEDRGEIRSAIVEAVQYGALRERLNEILATKLLLWREFVIPLQGEILERAILRGLEFRDSMTMTDLVPLVWPGEKYGDLETERYRKGVNRASAMLRRHSTGYDLKISKGIVHVRSAATAQ